MKRFFAFVFCTALASAAPVVCAGEFEPKIPRGDVVSAPAAPVSADATSAAPAASVAPAEIATPAVPALPAEPLTVLPGRQGYAVNRPEILARQRVFGRAHGVSLLAAACLDVPEQSGAVQEAYAAWHAKQAATIETVVHDLAHYYFGARAEAAQWPDLARALNLKDNIMPALGQFTLEVACASLTQVLDKPRYDLAKLLADPAAFDAPDVPAPPPAKASAPVVTPAAGEPVSASVVAPSEAPTLAPAVASPMPTFEEKPEANESWKSN